MQQKSRRRATTEQTTTPPQGEPVSLASLDGTSVDTEQVARRAYDRYAERGYEHGHDLDDWLEAERDVKGGSR